MIFLSAANDAPRSAEPLLAPADAANVKTFAELKLVTR